MAQKITTATCKQSLAKAWPQTFGADMPELAGKWTRVFKRGKKGEPIERVFFHDTLPVQALVVEKDGAIVESDIIIRGFAAFDCPEDSATKQEQAMSERADSNESFALFEKYPLFRASDFLFQVSTDEEAKDAGHTWYELYPTCDFGRGEAENDGQLDYMIKSHLPEGDGECMEATFYSPLSPADCEDELLKRGFVKSSTWVATSVRSGGGDED